MDENAFKILRPYFDPDQRTDTAEGGTPVLPASDLLAILNRYRDQLHDEVTGRPPHPYPVEPLEALAATRVLVESLTGAYGWLIGDAREAGASWADIGRALGVSKQAAWEMARRYADSIGPEWPAVRARARAALADTNGVLGCPTFRPAGGPPTPDSRL